MSNSLVLPEDALARLEARMDRIEVALDRLTGLLDQAPAAVAIAVDAADELARSGDVSERLDAASALLQRLTEPNVLASLERVIGHMESVPGHIGMAFDVTDAWVRKQSERGVDVDVRLKAAASLLETLTDPETIAALERSLAHVAVIEAGAGYAAAAPGYVGLAFDVVDEQSARLMADGVDIERAARVGLDMAVGVAKLLISDEAAEIHAAGLLEPEHLAFAARIANAIDETLRETPAAMGPWAMLSALKDPDVQRFVGFSFALAQRMGRAVEAPNQSLTRSTHV